MVQASSVVDHMSQMLGDGRAAEVVELCQWATRFLVAATPDIADTDAVEALLDRLDDLHLRACRAAPPDRRALTAYLCELACRHEDQRGQDIASAYLDLLGPEGHGELSALLAARPLRRHPSGR